MIRKQGDFLLICNLHLQMNMLWKIAFVSELLHIFSFDVC